MKKVFVIIICAMAALIFGYGIKYAVTPVSSQALESGTYEHAAAAAGYIIRDETAYYADRSGKLRTSVSVGSRVAKDSLIYSIYDSSVSDSVISELSNLDRKIADARSSLDAENYSSGSISVESEIAARTAQIIDAARSNSVAKISQYKNDINSLRANGSVHSSADELTELESRRDILESQISGSRGERFAENSGVFTMYCDGMEDILDENKLGEYTVEYIESLSAPEPKENRSDTVSQGDFVCSVVNNHVWSVLLVVPIDDIKGYEEGSPVTVRFKNIAGEEIKGKIAYISGEEQNKDGKCLVLVECSEYFEGAFSYREADVDLIFESYSGYRVPIGAIRTEGTSNKVIGIADNKQYECDIEVLYTDTDEGYAIVDSADNAEHKLSSVDRILVGER